MLVRNNHSGLEQLIVSVIIQTPGVEKVILYGSRAHGDKNPQSDYDIAVVAPNLSEREWLDLCDRVDGIETLFDVQVVRFDQAEKELQEKVQQEGIVLYERY